jgi:hypothetical protein
LSAAEVKQIISAIEADGKETRDYIGKLLVSGYKVGQKQYPGGNMVDVVTQSRVTAILELLKRPDLTPEQITAAVQAGLENGVVTVDVNVAGGAQ